MAKAADVDRLDEQISTLLESIEIEARENGSAAPPVQEEAPAPPASSRQRERAKPAPARPPARKQAKAAPPRRKARPGVEVGTPKRKPAPAPKGVTAERPAATRVRAQAPPRARTRPRARRGLLADPATRELAFFVLAGLMIGVAIGALIALSG